MERAPRMDTQPTPTVAPVEILDHGILCIDTLQERRRLACCYLIERDGEYAFVEAGTSHGVPRLLALLEARGIAPERVRYVLPTHVHLDHAGGAGVLMRALPEAKMVVHPRGARHMIDPSKLIAGAEAVYGAEALMRMYGEIAPVDETRVIQAQDGLRLSLGGGELEFIDTPGHARHHYSIWDTVSEGFFTGDTFGLSYRDFDGPSGPFLMPTTTPVQFDAQAWLQTIDRYLSYRPKRMYLTHYSAIEDVATRAAELRAGIGRYVQIARSLADAPERHSRLREALLDDALSALHRLDAPVSDARARELLEFDIELNAQGLGVWLDQAA
jgi:glyoxylase-like metal-dependent hydrolase (beta-lactamase superfamily II)